MEEETKQEVIEEVSTPKNPIFDEDLLPSITKEDVIDTSVLDFGF